MVDDRVFSMKAGKEDESKEENLKPITCFKLLEEPSTLFGEEQEGSDPGFASVA
jgi:hypothetical protein